jgi:hypothetical protein
MRALPWRVRATYTLPSISTFNESHAGLPVK